MDILGTSAQFIYAQLPDEFDSWEGTQYYKLILNEPLLFSSLQKHQNTYIQVI